MMGRQGLHYSTQTNNNIGVSRSGSSFWKMYDNITQKSSTTVTIVWRFE